ncbi:MAG: LysR family transcriptional regulator [Christensenellaceae bacterium]|nr:LysR family transcriptional regulator [Christensenellaceae bacterium]
MTGLKPFEYVVALAKYMNFSQAAAALGISQSSLSQYVQKLEKELGVYLFDRTTASLRLTQYGEIYLAGARRILDISAEMQEGIHDADDGAAGVLRVGISPSRAPFLLPPVVERFAKLYPGVALQFVESKSKNILKNIDEGNIDFAYTITSGLAGGKDYRILPVDSEEIMLVCAKGYGIAVGDDGKVDVTTLGRLRFVALEDDQLLTNDLYQLCASSGVTPQVAVSVSEISTAVAIVKSGFGVMLLPSSYRSYGSLEEELDFYSVAQPRPRRELAIIMRREKHLNRPAKALVDILTGLQPQKGDL